MDRLFRIVVDTLSLRRWIRKIIVGLDLFFKYVGRISFLFFETVGWVFTPPLKKRLIIDQMNKIGVTSVPIVFLTSLFTGMVLALQSAYQMEKVGASLYISGLVALSMTRELGPVLTALVVAGRVGAGITAELGTMKVTEQIDALQTLATNPVRYLVVPRFLAALLMIPILTVYSDVVGMLGGYLVGVLRLGISSKMYVKMTWDVLAFKDVLTGLCKSIFFAGIISIVGCHEGFATRGGAEGVGRATTASVVVSFISIIAANCLLTALFYFAFRF